MYSWQFSKKFPLPKNGSHFVFSNFCQKMEKHKFATISLTKRFRRNFRPTGYLRNVLLAIFKKISPPQKWQPFCIFEFLPKNGKTQICYYLLNQAISSKFSTHRVSEKCTLGNFQKNFPSPKMAAILYFRIFAKNGKTQICYYLLNRAR